MQTHAARQKVKELLWALPLGALAALIVGLGLWPQDAHADWRSLSGLLPAHVGRVDYVISPDSSIVAFVTDKDTDDVDELYAVPITGTAPIKLNPTLVASGDVRRFAFAPDSQAVLYVADQEVDNRDELYSVPVGGGEPLKLNSPLVAGGNVGQFTIDASNARVVYVADQETNEVYELWSVPLAGGQAVKLNGTLAPGGNIGIFKIDPLSDRVVYSAEQDTAGKYELYSVPIVGGVPLKLNPPIILTGGGDGGLYSEFDVNPVVPVVVFEAREVGSQGGRIYMIPTAGGELTQLSFNLLPAQRIVSFRISPAGDRVVFNVGTNQNQFAFRGKLYSNLIGGGGPADVSESADPLFGVDDFRILPDGSRVVYRFQANADAQVRLEAATLLGVRTALYEPGQNDAPLYSFAFSPDSDWVIYQNSSEGLPKNVYAIPPTGGNATNFGPSQYRAVAPDSARIAYSRVVTTENRSELFSAQIFGGDERNLSGLEGAGYIIDVKISGNSQWIVFTTVIDDQYDLRVSDGAVAQPPTPTGTPTSTPTVTPTVTSTPTVTPTPTATPTVYNSHLPALMRQP